MKTLPIVFAALFCITAIQLDAQKFFTRDGHITFFSAAPLENIEAHNRQATSVVDAATGDIEFAVLIKGFQFEKALMQEHFNENYMESTKFPRATFKGKILNMDEIDLSKDGVYTANVKGDLSIRGITRPLETTANFIVKAGEVHATTKFDVAVSDYDITIPAVVRDNIARVIETTVNVRYLPLKQ